MKALRHLVVLCLFLLGTLVMVPSRVAADTGETPSFLTTVGGPDHAYVYPGGLDIGPDHDVVVADTGNNAVDKFAPTADGSGWSRVWTVGVHGSGVQRFLHPRDVGIDSSGNIYIADAENSRIVKLDANGNWLTSWAGPPGNTLSYPLGISVANNEVYVADTGRNKVRVFNTSGLLVQDITSVGSCTITKLRDVDADQSGNVYVANYGANNILKISADGTSCLSVWGSTGTSTGQFRAPYGVSVGTDPLVVGGQAVFVADANNNRVQEFDTSGNYVTTIGGPGTPSTPATFTQLRRVAATTDGSGDVWVADLWGWRVERFRRDPTASSGYSYVQTIGTPLPAPMSTAVFQEPHGIAFEADGSIDVADTVHHQIDHFDPSGNLQRTCGQRGGGLGQYNWPRGVAVDLATGNLWIADTKNNRIQIIKPTCNGVAKFGTFGTKANQFNWPSSIVINQAERIAYIADTYNNRIVSYSIASRAPIATYGTTSGQLRFSHPRGIAVDPANGDLLLADTVHNRIVELGESGGTITGVVSTYSGSFNQPNGVAADSAGRIYVADSNNSQVVVLDPRGQQLGVFNSPSGFDTPENLVVGPNGDLYVADTYHDRIQVYQGLPPAQPDLTASAPSAITVGDTTTDSASVTSGLYPGTGSSNPADGTVTFTLYGPYDTAADVTCDPATVVTTASDVPPASTSNVTASYTSPSTTLVVPGVYQWTSQYNGNANNLPAGGSCNDPNQQVTVG